MTSVVIVAFFFAILSSHSETISPPVEAAPEETGGELSAPLTPVVETGGDVLLFDFEHPDEVGRFVYGNVNTFVEQSSEMVRTGSASCVATYYIGSIRQGKRLIFYTLMHPARGRVSDWSVFREFQCAILNSEDFTVSLDVEFADGTNSVWRRYNLPPGVWSRIRQPLSDLARDGLNLSTIKRIGWSQLDTEIRGINTLYIDDVRLAGANPSDSSRVVESAWAAFEKWLNEEGRGIRASYIPIIHTEPSRIAQIQEQFDCGKIDGYVNTNVCIVGGGIAGSSAAISAGRLGVEVLVVEAFAFLGGTSTAAMVTPFMSNRVRNEDLSRGIFADIVAGLERHGGAERDRNRPGVVWFDKEIMKSVLNELVIDAGCRLMLNTWGEKPLVLDGVCKGVIVNNKSGRLAILADIVIDSTGDGDIAARAGCPFEMGRGYDQYTQSTTLFFRMGGVNTDRAFAAQAERLHRLGGEIPPNYMFADVFRREVAAGRFPADIPIGSVYFEHTLNPGVVSINATRTFEIDATNSGDLTYAAVETRRQALALAELMIRNIPGFERAFLQETGIQVGIRESRRILGEYQLTGSDVLHGAKFSDSIARGAFNIDIH
ncbi:MAG TPA: FAD-dependent oxidoreductase, partial [Firmicutes bacterium]|nr:FAD-dependent oxidoreductase [Bacillota bacterium]